MFEVLVFVGLGVLLAWYALQWLIDWKSEREWQPEGHSEPRYLFQYQTPDQMCEWEDDEGASCEMLGSYLWTDPRDMREHPVCWKHGEMNTARLGGFVDVR